METAFGTGNMEIWVIAIEIAYDPLDICEIKDDVCHVCTLHWGLIHTEG